jgi:hypothetical protein
MQSGADVAGDSYKINLYTTFSFDAADVTKATAESGGTQVATGFGYTQDSKVLTSVGISTFGTNGSKFTAGNPTWTASGGDIIASHALVYNDTDTDDPPLYYINFDAVITALDGAPFVINWDADGIATLTVV